MNDDGNSSNDGEDYPHNGPGIVKNQFLNINTKYMGSPERQQSRGGSPDDEEQKEECDKFCPNYNSIMHNQKPEPNNNMIMSHH